MDNIGIIRDADQLCATLFVMSDSPKWLTTILRWKVFVYVQFNTIILISLLCFSCAPVGVCIALDICTLMRSMYARMFVHE